LANPETRKPVAYAFGLAVLVAAAGLAAWPIGAGFLSSGELGRAREAASLLSRLHHPLLSPLPAAVPRCAAACLADDPAVPPGALEDAARLANALEALPGGSAEKQRAGQLAGLVRAALAPPVSGDGAAGPRREALALLSAMEADTGARLEQAGEALRSSLPWALGAAVAGLALGLLSLGAAARQTALRRRAEKGSAALLRAADQVRDLVTITDGKGRIEYVNKAVEDVTGYSRDELVGARSPSWLPWYQGVAFLPEMQRTVLSGKPYQAGVLGRRKTGEAFLAEETVTPLAGPEGAPTRILSTARDVTEQRLLEYTLEHRARHDLLTGLPNRRYLLRLLDQVLGPDAPPARSVAVLAVDVDRFTHMNDLLGSATGDLLLVEVAQLLRALTRQGDIVARLGSDEFALVRVDDARPVDGGAAADEVRQTLSGKTISP
jgi:diguanylate cyclase (GGDEF)-like protein/PAS domain S-box-containing protein